MALRLSCDGKLSDALCTSRAADPTNKPSEKCDQIYNSISSNVANCDYIDFYDNSTVQIFGMVTTPWNQCTLISDIFKKTLDDLHEFVSLLPFKPDVICLSESRINQPLNNFQIQGYNFFNAKPSKKAGGVAIYLSTKFNVTLLKSFRLYGTESLWLKICTNNSTKTILFGSIYQHPTEVSNKI